LIPWLILDSIFPVSLEFELFSIFVTFWISFNFFKGLLNVEWLKLIVFYEKQSVVYIIHIRGAFDKVAAESPRTFLPLVLRILVFHGLVTWYVLSIYCMHYFLLNICLRYYFLVLLSVAIQSYYIGSLCFLIFFVTLSFWNLLIIPITYLRIIILP
jgi:hypothetical protein